MNRTLGYLTATRSAASSRPTAVVNTMSAPAAASSSAASPFFGSTS